LAIAPTGLSQMPPSHGRRARHRYCAGARDQWLQGLIHAVVVLLLGSFTEVIISRSDGCHASAGLAHRPNRLVVRA
jgi:hypothetical protein